MPIANVYNIVNKVFTTATCVMRQSKVHKITHSLIPFSDTIGFFLRTTIIHSG